MSGSNPPEEPLSEEAPPHEPLSRLVDRLRLGARAAQRDAERMASSLLREGHIDEQQARAAVAAVGKALEAQVARVDREWWTPVARVASGWLREEPAPAVEERLAAIEERLGALERQLARDSEG